MILADATTNCVGGLLHIGPSNIGAIIMPDGKELFAYKTSQVASKTESIDKCLGLTQCCWSDSCGVSLFLQCIAGRYSGAYILF